MLNHGIASKLQADICCPACGRPKEIASEDLDISFVGRDCWVQGQIKSLTPRELSVLKHLVSAYPLPASREVVFASIWSPQTDDKILDVYICALRKILKDTTLRIVNVWGVGYQIAKHVAR